MEKGESTQQTSIAAFFAGLPILDSTLQTLSSKSPLHKNCSTIAFLPRRDESAGRTNGGGSTLN